MTARYRTFLDDYAAYHRDPKNKLTHYFGIPLIVFAIFILLRPVVLFQAGGVSVDLAMVIAIPAIMFYLSLHLTAGIAMGLLFAVMYFAAPYLNMWVGWGFFVFGWALQFLGHHYEGKKPAFFKNLTHLLIGPLWILNDALLVLRLPAYNASQTGKA